MDSREFCRVCKCKQDSVIRGTITPFPLIFILFFSSHPTACLLALSGLDRSCLIMVQVIFFYGTAKLNISGTGIGFHCVKQLWNAPRDLCFIKIHTDSSSLWRLIDRRPTQPRPNIPWSIMTTQNEFCIVRTNRFKVETNPPTGPHTFPRIYAECSLHWTKLLKAFMRSVCQGRCVVFECALVLFVYVWCNPVLVHLNLITAFFCLLRVLPCFKNTTMITSKPANTYKSRARSP